MNLSKEVEESFELMDKETRALFLETKKQLSKDEKEFRISRHKHVAFVFSMLLLVSCACGVFFIISKDDLEKIEMETQQQLKLQDKKLQISKLEVEAANLKLKIRKQDTEQAKLDMDENQVHAERIAVEAANERAHQVRMKQMEIEANLLQVKHTAESKEVQKRILKESCISSCFQYTKSENCASFCERN